jgi:hypothetical protein
MKTTETYIYIYMCVCVCVCVHIDMSQVDGGRDRYILMLGMCWELELTFTPPKWTGGL